jgi:lipopolysaccharide export system protein LptC
LAIAYPESAKGFSAKSRGSFERNYRAARRHSRHVRILRVGVLAGIAALLLSVVVINYLPPIGGFRLPGELGRLVINGTTITMQQPRLTGFTTDSRAYEFSADSAAQDITKPNLVVLTNLNAKMEMQDKSTVQMTAVAGTYDVKTEMLQLNNNIHLVSSTGYEGRLSEALVDVRKGNVVSDHPVWVKMLDGFLNAQRLDIVDNGSVVRFSGVAMTLQPNKDDKNGAGNPDSSGTTSGNTNGQTSDQTGQQ